MASVRVRTATGLFFAALVVGALFAANLFRPGVEPWSVGFVLAGLAAFELGRMGRLGGARRALVLPLITGVLSLALLLLLLQGPLTPAQNVLVVLGLQLGALVLGILVGAPAAPSTPDPGGLAGLLRGRIGTGLFSAWLGPPMASLGLVHASYGTAALATLLVLSKLGDVAGYFVGRSIGRSHPFPRLSPGKTTAGCVASLVTGTVAGAGAGTLGLLPGDPPLVVAAGIGAVLNVAAQAADLFESFVKRAAGVKDSSRMAGASGGVLDVIDSLLFTLPVALALFALTVR